MVELISYKLVFLSHIVLYSFVAVEKCYQPTSKSFKSTVASEIKMVGY